MSSNRLHRLETKSLRGRSNPKLRPSRPITAGQRHQRSLTNVEDGLQWTPKELRVSTPHHGGRNQHGRRVVRHHGSGDKQSSRRVRPLWPGHRVRVLGTQWDPQRTAPVSLVLDRDLLETMQAKAGDPKDPMDKKRGGANEASLRSYVLTGQGMKMGSRLEAPTPDAPHSTVQKNTKAEAEEAMENEIDKEKKGVQERTSEVLPNTRCRRAWLPVGTTVYDRSMSPDHPMESSRFKAAGASGSIVSHGNKRGGGESNSETMEGDQDHDSSMLKKENRTPLYTRVRCPSGEERRIPSLAYATVGKVSCEDHMLETLGKAGVLRSQGVRPTVRGCAMNPIDHPHGGRTKGGRHDVTPWAKIAKGQATRSNMDRSVFVLKTSRQKKHGYLPSHSHGVDSRSSGS